MIYRLDPDGNITFISDAVKRYGYSPKDLVGRHVLDIVHPDDRQTAVNRINERRSGDRGTRRFEVRLLSKKPKDPIFQSSTEEKLNFRNCVIDADGLYNTDGRETSVLVGTQGVIRDITEAKQAEEEKNKLEAQLQQSQKMEAIGTLAGGIAHDFNNILTAIIGYTELSRMKLPEDSEVLIDLKEIFHAGKRAKDLVQQILTFSRQTAQESRPVQVKSIVKETLKLLRASLPSTIEIQQNIRSNSLIMGDPTQIHQLLMNLCTNAGQAMQEKGGVLEVSLDDVECDSDYENKFIDLRPGAYMRLMVSDTGCGIPAEIQNRIFEPFYTTRAKGDGTGMGLAVVHGILKSLEGAVQVHSELGKRSRFEVFLPIIETPVETAEEPLKTLHQGKERILYVDDEKPIAEVGKLRLEHLGYEVTAKTSSIEAFELFKCAPDNFDLVITDLTMPKMTGLELARELTAVRPDIPIILCTGYHIQMTEKDPEKTGIQACLMKPIILNELAETVRTVLDTKKSTALSLEKYGCDDPVVQSN